MASLTIIEWSDFECPHCRRAAPILHRVLRELDGRARLVFKHYPLEGHERAEPAARAAIAAGRQNKFWEMHDLLFENQTTLAQADFERFATRLGLDLERFRTDMRSEQTTRTLRQDREAGERVPVEGTPTIVVNGRLFMEPIEDLLTYLREELEG